MKSTDPCLSGQENCPDGGEGTESAGTDRRGNLKINSGEGEGR